MRINKLKLAIKIIILILIMQLVVAQSQPSCPPTAPSWYCTQINQAAYSTFAKWEPVIILAVLFSFTIAAVIFMAGVAARNKKLVDYGVGEFYEAGASLIFVVFFMLLASLLFGTIPGLYIGNADPYNTSLTYIYNTINATEGLITALYNPAMVAYLYTSVEIHFDTLAFFTTLYNYLMIPLEVLFIIPATALSSLLIEGLIILYLEFYLILFAMYAAIPVLLIPGIFLRSIIPTRTVGGLLIGAAIAFFLILPTLFSIAFFFTSKGTMQQFILATSQLNSISQGSDAITNGALPNGPNSIPQEIKSIQAGMGSFWISVIFYPSLILALTYFAITTIADLLGGMAPGGGIFRRI